MSTIVDLHVFLFMKRFLARSLLSNHPSLFLLNLVALVGVGVMVYQSNLQLVGTVQQEIQAKQTVESLQQTLTLITDAETGQRGYGFTRLERFLEPYYEALIRLDTTLKQLQVDVATDPEQQAKFQQLQILIQNRLALLQEAIQLQQKSFELNTQIQLSEQGKVLHDQIRLTIAQMQNREQERIQQLTAHAQQWSRVSNGSLFVGLGLSLILFTWLYRLLNRQMKLQRQQSTILARNEEQLRLALEAARIGLWDWDMQTGEIVWSKEHAELLGLTLDQFDGHYETFAARVYPDDRDGLKQSVQTALKHRSSYQHEFRVVWPDQSIHWIEGRGHAFYDAEGQAYRISGTIMDIDARKQAEIHQQQVEAALRESEQQYVSLAATVPVGIFRTTADGSCFYVNERWCEIAGFGAEQALGPGWAKALHPDDRERVAAAWYEAAQKHRIFRMEYRFQRPDGSVTWVLGQTMAEIAADGQVLGYVGTITDISDRKQTETALMESEMRFHVLVDAMFEGILIQENGKIIDANPGLTKMFGYSVEELLNKSITDFLTPESAAIAMRHIQNHYEQPYEMTGIRKDGTLINVEVIGKQAQYQGRQVRVAALRDITAQKQAEIALYQLNQELEARVIERTAELQQAMEEVEDLYNRAPCGYHSLDVEGYFVQINQTELDWLGYTREEILYQKKFSDLTTPESTQQFQTNFSLTKQQGYIKDREYQMIRKDGSIFDVSINAIVFKDRQGNVLLHRATMMDISDRKRIEAEQQRVARMKDEFMSVVSHELRTPLTAVYGALNLLSEGTVPPNSGQGNRIIQIAAENAKRLVNLVSDILDLERLESGKISLCKQPCNVSTLLTTAVNLNQLLANRAGIRLEVTAVDLEVMLDRDRILQVLTNLLTNAIKFSFSGGTVVLKAEFWGGRERESGGNGGVEGEWRRQTSPLSSLTSSSPPHLISSSPPYLLFSITDQGRGIPSDKLEAIFERFQQVDASDSRKHGGTGLGLAICRNIIQQHGGGIWVESMLGEGSRFYFTIPLERG